MKTISRLLLVISVFILFSCAHSTEITSSKKKLLYNFRVGGNWGGFIENTEVDAISGVTRTRLAIGYHLIKPIGNQGIEAGMDIIGQDQILTYYNDEKIKTGENNFRYTSLFVPVTFNWNIWRKGPNQPYVAIKIGVAGIYVFDPKVVGSGSTLPYDWNHFSFGPTIGFVSKPFTFSKDYQLGVHMDFYRGSKIYDDVLQAEGESKGFSSLQFGVNLTF